MTEPMTSSLPLPLYLGPQLPRWQPRTAADVQAAIDNGTLTERHWLDVKLTLGGSSHNKEIACDLASYANDGGALIYGVSEDKASQTLSLAPLDLAGQAERIDEIARSRCDPPLYVACHPLPLDPNDRSCGLLLVEIPPSPASPHMVDGRYYGRGDTTRRKLTDSEVARLHAVRTMRQLTAEQLIEQEIARDPVPLQHRKRSHVYVVARPLATPPDLLTEAIENRALGDMVRGLSNRLGTPASPHWGYLESEEPRAAGWGFRSYRMFGRRPDPDADVQEENIVDLEVGDDGRLILFCGRGSDFPRGQDQQFVLDAVAALFTRGIAELAGQIGREYGYGGRWMLALGLTNLSGKMTSAALNGFGGGYVPYSAERYIESTEAVTSELLAQPGAVTHRLIRRLMRGLGTGAHGYQKLVL
ncbi:ATP-binding protein [Micromonospora purpureochromogenes]|uniref:AlbA family DNA-binding domain-containing protein n=1 Tax=Micromonospora purpureochromogenes TaxID=47872 RepID=UPI003411B2AA